MIGLHWRVSVSPNSRFGRVKHLTYAGMRTLCGRAFADSVEPRGERECSQCRLAADRECLEVD